MEIKVKMSEEKAKQIIDQAVAHQKKYGWPTQKELEEKGKEQLRVTFVFYPTSIEKVANGEMKNPPYVVDNPEEIREQFQLKHHKLSDVHEIIIDVK